MSTIAFILTMPGNNAWNGKWSGEGTLYAVVRRFSDSKAGKARVHGFMVDAPKASFGYSFGDGWYARVTAQTVDAKEARTLRKNSKGFCGYEWMIDSIVANGQIVSK